MRWSILRILLATGAVVAGLTAAVSQPSVAPTVSTGPVPTDGSSNPVSSSPVETLLPASPNETIPVPKGAPLFGDDLPLDPGPVPDGLANLSAQGCNACHFEVHSQWALSPHAQSWAKVDFQEAMNRVGDSTACRSCHLPLQSQHSSLAKGYYEGDPTRPEMAPNESWDATMMTEGVTCVTCHVRDGKVLSSRPVTQAPHPMALSPELGSSTVCATCHQLSWDGADSPIYDTYGEWSRSAYATAGVRCQDCHMPPVAGLATASRFAAMASHGLDTSPARALSLLVDLESDVIERGVPWPLTIRVQNTGAGHAVPTGSPFKQLRLVATLVDAKGRALATPIVKDFGRQISDTPPWETLSDERILPGSEALVQGDITVSQRKRSGSVELEVKLEKRIGDKVVESTELQRIPLSLQ